MSSLQYSSIHSSIPPVPLVFYVRFLSHSVGNPVQLVFPSPSPMYPRTPPSTFNISRFPLGAPSDSSIHLSQCRLFVPASPTPTYAWLSWTLLFFRPSRPFGHLPPCNCSTRTSNPCCRCNSILFLRRLSVSSSLFPPSPPSSPSPLSPSLRLFSPPPFRQHPDVHLSLTSGWFTWA